MKLSINFVTFISLYKHKLLYKLDLLKYIYRYFESCPCYISNHSYVVNFMFRSLKRSVFYNFFSNFHSITSLPPRVEEFIYNVSRSRSHTIFETRRNYYTAGSQGFVEAYQRRGGTKRRGRVTRVISTMETGLSTGGGVGVRAVWVQRFAIITFRACRFVCINSVRQFPLCGVHSRARISSSPPSVLPLPASSLAGRSRIRRVRAARSRAILSRKDLLSAGIGKRFIFPALFSPPVRYSSLSHVCTRCSSGSASVSS